MNETPLLRSPRWWPWAAAILLTVAGNLVLLGSQGGECFDYVVESGATSTCTNGPALGIPGMWLSGIVSVLAVIYFVWRLVRAIGATRT